MNKSFQKNEVQSPEEQPSETLTDITPLSALNSGYFIQIIQAQLSGKIVLPHALGLSEIEYQDLKAAINDSELNQKEAEWNQDKSEYLRQRAEFCAEMFAMKSEEHEELKVLLNSYCSEQAPFSDKMAVIVATASLTKFHLWESLGLVERTQLSDLIRYNFPELYALNTKNMRWKRFFYHQLCEQEGSYLCKAPSCEECKSYSECFA